MLRGTTEATSSARLDRLGTESAREADRGEFGGRKVTLGGVLKVAARVVAAVLTLGLSEVGIALYKRAVRHETAPPGSDRARQVLDGPPTKGTQATAPLADRSGVASREFTREVEGVANAGVKNDLSKEGLFATRGVHESFFKDANRAIYVLNGEELERDAEAVVGKFGDALSAEELRTASAILHQGIMADALGQLALSEHSFEKGVATAGPDNEMIYSLSVKGGGEGEARELTATIESRMPIRNWINDKGVNWCDQDRSFLNVKMTGTIHPGGDPVFRLTEPLAYDLRLIPGDPP